MHQNNFRVGKIITLTAFFMVLFGVYNILISLISSENYSFWQMGIFIVSIGIAFFAIGLSFESDTKIKAILTASVLSIISTFENRRIDFQQYPSIIHIELWNAYEDMDSLKEIFSECKIKQKYFNKLAVKYNTLLMTLNIKRIKKVLLCEDYRHIVKMHKIILGLDLESDIIIEISKNYKIFLTVDVEITKEFLDRFLDNLRNDEYRYVEFEKVRNKMIPT